MKPSEKLKVYSPVEGVDGNIIAFDIHATLMKVLDYLDEQASKEESIVGRLDNAGLYRQLFAEMDKGKTFTAEELYNLFESYAPLDPKGLLKKAFEAPQAQEKSCCKDCLGGWSDIANQFGCLKVDCTCHTPQAQDVYTVLLECYSVDNHNKPVSERNEEEWENPNFHKNACDHRATPLNYICDCPCHSERNALIDELIEDIDFAMSKTRKANVPINLYDYVIELLKSKKK